MINFKNADDNAPIVENESGGKQSVTIGDFTLLPSYFANQYIRQLAAKIGDRNIARAYILLESFLNTEEDLDSLIRAVDELTKEPLTIVSKVLTEGLNKYPRDNWKLVDFKDHINHAMCHLYMYLHGDTQDQHIEHAICRIALAYDTYIASDEPVKEK